VWSLIPQVVQPVQDTNQDGWWKWVALSLIGLLVLGGGAFAFLILRDWITGSD
jgi:hypothetical protein